MHLPASGATLRLWIAFALSMTYCGRAAWAATGSFEPGQVLLIDSNASQGNGQLFSVDRATGAATRLGGGFGLEPWSLVVQSPTIAYAADTTGETVYRFNLSTGSWTSITTGTHLLRYPSAAIVAESDHTVLVGSGLGKVIRVDTNTGLQSLFADYGSLGAGDPWGMAPLPDGGLVVSDLFNGKIIRIAPNGSSSLVSSGGLLHSTAGIVALPDGNIAVGDDNLHGQYSLVRVNLTDGSQSYLTPLGSFSRRLNGLTLDTNGDLLAAANQNDNRGLIYRVNPGSGQITTFSASGLFANPAGLVIVPEPVVLPLLTAGTMLRYRRAKRSAREFATVSSLPPSS